MKGKGFLPILLVLLALLIGIGGATAYGSGVIVNPSALTAPLGTAFSYQGRLTDGDNPANGSYDFRFILYNASSGGAQVGGTLTKPNVSVTDGYFTVELDFYGSGVTPFNGEARYLEIGVKPSGSSGDFSTFSSRQALNPAPYALYAANIPTHKHLGETWTGSDNPLVISGTFGPNRAPLELSNSSSNGYGLLVTSSGYKGLVVKNVGNMSQTGYTYEKTGVLVGGVEGYGLFIGITSNDGIFVMKAEKDGVEIYEAYANGVNINYAGGDGVSVYSAGDPTTHYTSTHNNGFEVAGAQGHGVYVGRADINGLQVDSAHYDGLYVTETGRDGVRVASVANNGLSVYSASNDGVYIESAGGDFIQAGSNADPKFRVDSTGAAYADGGWNGAADFAELISVDGEVAKYEPGDVLVISLENDRSVTLSSDVYSPLVIGVFSEEPGFLGSPHTMEGQLENEIPVAVVGIVSCKVTTENGPIQRGDLLVTSSTPGHAMRADNPSPGTILGKALEALDSGNGIILVLVTLQ